MGTMVTGLPAPIHAVERPVLCRRLDEALNQKVALIVAPAGAGKSVLLAQWAAAHPELAFVWMSLSAADDDPVRFAQRFLQGLATVSPTVAELGTLISLHGGGLGTPLLEALGSQLEEAPETVIVLDDLHRLSNPTLIADLARLVELLPAQAHLVLASRVDPPIAWSGRRLTRDLTELRQADLAFDESDSAQLLERITGRRLRTDQVGVLVDRTEGWAAGLQLAGMMLRLHDDPDDFIIHFSGNDRLVADFLSEEVLEAQPVERRRFLLQISVVDEICSDLAVHLTGDRRAQLVLEELERESMFLIPLDDRRQWYRFHHLFRDLLAFRLRAEGVESETELLGRAAAWHLEQGDANAGIEYLVRGRRWEDALDLITSRGTEFFERGQGATVIRWITEMPAAVRSDRKEVTLLLAWLLGAEGRAAGCEDLLHGVVGDSAATPGEPACAQTLLATLAQFRSWPQGITATAWLTGQDRPVSSMEVADGPEVVAH